MSAHAKYSPSAYERWSLCPGSVRLISQVERRESAAAFEGTQCHTCLEIFLKNGPGKRRKTREFLERKYPHQMVLDARNAALAVWGMHEKGELESESKVRLDHIDENLWGTLDVSIAEAFGTLQVIDLKYGKFVPVEPTKNGQLSIYAVGKAREHHYNFEKVRLTIIQPRAKHVNGPIRYWEAPMTYFFEFEREVKEAVKRVKDPKAPVKAGAHCFFCDAKKICKAYSKDAISSVRASFAQNAESDDERTARMAELF